MAKNLPIDSKPSLPPLMARIELSIRVERKCGMTRARLLSADERRAALFERVANAVIHRINFPKTLAGKMTREASLSAKGRPLLTEQECQDARQSVAMVLCATDGASRLEAGERLTLEHWKLMFREVRGRDCLGIDRRAKNKEGHARFDAMTEAEISMASLKLELPTLPAARRSIIARQVRYARAVVSAAFHADPSRKAKANFRFASKFIRFLASQYKQGGEFGIGEVTKGNTGEALRVASFTFRNYFAKGEAILTAEALASIPVKMTREFRAFSDIPENYAISE